MGDKKVAKKIALTFHNTLMEDGKKSKFSDYTWNLKYLHRYAYCLSLCIKISMIKSKYSNIYLSEKY